MLKLILNKNVITWLTVQLGNDLFYLFINVRHYFNSILYSTLLINYHISLNHNKTLIFSCVMNMNLLFMSGLRSISGMVRIIKWIYEYLWTQKNDLHLTMKPLNLVSKTVNNSSVSGNIV